MKAIIAFLLMWNCEVTEDTLVLVPHMDKPGYSIGGKAYVREGEPDNVKVHELYHTCQPLAVTDEQWQHNEEEAHRIETIWMQQSM